MKSMSIAMAALLTNSNPGILPLTTLILIQRTDGVTLGFTSWDIAIFYNGVTYQPALSIDPSGVKVNADLTTDQMDIKGAIDSINISEQDLDGGRYDLAVVTIMRINPYDVTMGVIVELTGTIGQIDYGDGIFQVAINSIGQQLNQQIGDIITPTCRVNQLGDAQCKVNIATYRYASTVATVVDQRTLVFNDTHATDWFKYGMIRFANLAGGGGLNYSLNMEVKSSTLSGSQNTLVLQESMPFTVQVGDAVTLEAGCDRRGITCRNKFSNLVNIHCEPYVPGNDYLLATGRPPS